MKNFTFLKPFIDNFIDTFFCALRLHSLLKRGNCPKNIFPVMLMILVDVCLRIPRWNMMLNVPKYLHLYVYNVSVNYNIVHYQKIKDFFFPTASTPLSRLSWMLPWTHIICNMMYQKLSYVVQCWVVLDAGLFNITKLPKLLTL